MTTRQRHRHGHGGGRRGEHQIDQAGARDPDGRTEAHRGHALPAAGSQVAAHLAAGQRPADPQHGACLLDREHQRQTRHRLLNRRTPLHPPAWYTPSRQSTRPSRTPPSGLDGPEDTSGHQRTPAATQRTKGGDQGHTTGRGRLADGQPSAAPDRCSTVISVRRPGETPIAGEQRSIEVASDDDVVGVRDGEVVTQRPGFREQRPGADDADGQGHQSCDCTRPPSQWVMSSKSHPPDRGPSLNGEVIRRPPGGVGRCGLAPAPSERRAGDQLRDG